METINYPETVTAKKEHICNFCGCKINKGEKYSIAVFKHDYIYSWKSHLKCLELANKLKMYKGEGVTHELFEENINEAFEDIWIEKDPAFYKSKDFKYPSLEEMIKFVYEHACKKND